MKTIYLQTRASRLQKELEIEEMDVRASKSTMTPCNSVPDLIAKQEYLRFLHDVRRAELAALALCEQEEEAAKEDWLTAKRELQSMEKLHELDLEAFTLEEQRRTQNELDELALLRRPA